MWNKQNLRAYLRKCRKEYVKSADLTALSQALLAQFKELIPNLEGHVVAGYEAMGSEISVDILLNYAQEFCPVVLPKVVGDGQMVFEPDLTPTIILVPLIGFDAKGHRLGQGGGYYDRFLASYPKVITIGVAYDCQEVPEIPTEPHDMVLTYILTPSRVIHCCE